MFTVCCYNWLNTASTCLWLWLNNKATIFWFQCACNYETVNDRTLLLRKHWTRPKFILCYSRHIFSPKSAYNRDVIVALLLDPPHRSASKWPTAWQWEHLDSFAIWFYVPRRVRGSGGEDMRSGRGLFPENISENSAWETIVQGTVYFSH